MSTEAANLAWQWIREECLPAHLYPVLLHLAFKAREDRPNHPHSWWESKEQMAATLGKSDRQVRRDINQLRTLGVIQIHTENPYWTGRKNRVPGLYQINPLGGSSVTPQPLRGVIHDLSPVSANTVRTSHTAQPEEVPEDSYINTPPVNTSTSGESLPGEAVLDSRQGRGVTSMSPLSRRRKKVPKGAQKRAPSAPRSFEDEWVERKAKLMNQGVSDVEVEIDDEV